MSVFLFPKSLDLFTGGLKLKTNQVIIDLQINVDFTTTQEIQPLCDLLQANVPHIFDCKCFNQNKLAFTHEVKQTELGHLYEHILLEYLVDLKYKQTKKQATFSAWTSWDWYKNPRNSYRIELEIKSSDYAILYQAIKKTHTLMELIIYSHKSYQVDPVAMAPTASTSVGLYN